MSSEAVLKKMQAATYPLTLDTIIDKRVPLFLVALFGTTLAYFEFYIYGFLTPILAHHFFPTDDPTVALLKALSVFAIGSLAKPIGALIFGYLGDTKGRSITLRYTMIGVAIPTFIVGILPSYNTWGWVAVAILILCRMFQGIFMAGESDGVRIYIFEHFGHKRPCLISACISCSAYTGIALATYVAMQIPTEGETWRWVFFASSASGILIYILRRHLIETPPFLRLKQNPQPLIPLRNIVRSCWPSLLKTIMICGTIGGVHHFYFLFQVTYLSKTLGYLPYENALQYGLYLITIYVLTFPIAGWVADRWGYAKVGKIGGIVALSLAIINLLVIKDEFVSLPVMVLTTISMAFFVVPAYLFLTQQYDVNIRFRSFSLGHAIGSMIFSGTGPVICLFLWTITGLSYVPYIYFSLIIMMGVSTFIWRARSNAYNAWFL